MSTTEDISASPSKTLLPAKQPEINPWLQRKFLKPSTSSSNSAPSSDLSPKDPISKWPPAEKAAGEIPKENFETSDIGAAGESVVRPSTSQKIKPTGKEKWVPYDATIIVDSEASKKKKPANKKKKNNKKKQDGSKEPNKEASESNGSKPKNGNTNNGNKKKGERKGRQDSRKVETEAITDSNIDELGAQIGDVDLDEGDKNADSAAGDNITFKYEQPSTNPEQVEESEVLSANETEDVLSPPFHPGSPPFLEDQGRRRSSSSRSGRSHYNNVPRFRRSSSQMGLPMLPPLYPPMPPNYLYQPIYQPYYPVPPGYQMNGYNHGRNGRREESRNNSSTSSVDDLGAPSPSQASNGLGYNKNSDPFFPQQYLGYYPFPQQQPLYQMMAPPSPHHMPPYIPEGGPIYNNEKRPGVERLSRLNSTFNDRELDVALQLDYYFSKENLIKDTFLRSNMQDGLVNLSVIMNFLRFKALTGGNIELAINSLAKCSNIEYKVVDGEYFLKSKFEYFFKK